MKIVLIAGGTDKNLIFKDWAVAVKKRVERENLYLLDGSATKKMVRALKKISYFKNIKPRLFENLEAILASVRGWLRVMGHKSNVTILFSPGAASFEKFKNEFDRGEKFNLHSKKIF